MYSTEEGTLCFIMKSNDDTRFREFCGVNVCFAPVKFYKKKDKGCMLIPIQFSYSLYPTQALVYQSKRPKLGLLSQAGYIIFQGITTWLHMTFDLSFVNDL